MALQLLFLDFFLHNNSNARIKMMSISKKTKIENKENNTNLINFHFFFSF